MLLPLIIILWVLVWILAVVDMVRRRDMSTWSKVAWGVAMLVFPVVGILVYLIVRPWQPGDSGMGGHPGADPAYERLRDSHSV